MLKTIYYILFGLLGLLGVYFVITSFFGRFSIWGAPEGYSKMILLLAAVAGSFLLYRAYLLGEKQGRWGAGLGMVLLALLAFEGIITLGAVLLKLLHQTHQ